ATVRTTLSSIDRVEFSADGRTLASAGSDTRIALLDTHAGTVKHLLIGHNDIVADLAFDANQQQLASVARNGEVIVWDLVSGDPKSQSGSLAQSNGAQRTIDGGTANGATSSAAIAANSNPSNSARSATAADSTSGAGDSVKASS